MFSDRIGREVDGKGRGRKKGTQPADPGNSERSPSIEGALVDSNGPLVSSMANEQPTPQKENPQEGEAREAPLGDAGAEELSGKDNGLEQKTDTSTALEEMVADLMKKKALLEKKEICDVDLESRILVAERVRERLRKEGSSSDLNLSQLIDETSLELMKSDKKDINLVASGGILGSMITLCAADINPIQNFTLGNDRSVMFTLSFLTKWGTEAGMRWVVVDSIRSGGWWDIDLSRTQGKVEALSSNFYRYGMRTEEFRQDIWRSDVCFMPICGRGHWSLIVVLNLLELRSTLRDEEGGGTTESPPPTRTRVMFVDSLGNASPHVTVSGNIYHFLRACYPGKKVPTVRHLRRAITTMAFRFTLQEDRECGFYATYHTSILSRAMSRIGKASAPQIEVILKEGHAAYTFAQYRKDVSERLKDFMETYLADQREVNAGPWLWGAGAQDCSLHVENEEHAANSTVEPVLNEDLGGNTTQTRKRKASSILPERPRKIGTGTEVKDSVCSAVRTEQKMDLGSMDSVEGAPTADAKVEEEGKEKSLEVGVEEVVKYIIGLVLHGLGFGGEDDDGGGSQGSKLLEEESVPTLKNTERSQLGEGPESRGTIATSEEKVDCDKGMKEAGNIAKENTESVVPSIVPSASPLSQECVLPEKCLDNEYAQAVERKYETVVGFNCDGCKKGETEGEERGLCARVNEAGSGGSENAQSGFMVVEEKAFLEMVNEATELAHGIGNISVQREWEAYKAQILSLLTKMRVERTT